MIKITAYDNKVSGIFSGFLTSTGLDCEHSFYRRVMAIETDVKFFNELISRFPSSSAFEFQVHLSMDSLIYGQFLKRINATHYRYDFKFLAEQVYVFEVLKRIFSGYWIDGKGINPETVRKVIQFHPVVRYYVGLEHIEDYLYDFIGSSFAASEFKKELYKLNSEQEQERSVATMPNSEQNPDSK